MSWGIACVICRLRVELGTRPGWGGEAVRKPGWAWVSVARHMLSVNVMGYSLCHLPTSCGGETRPGWGGRGREDEAGLGRGGGAETGMGVGVSGSTQVVGECHGL